MNRVEYNTAGFVIVQINHKVFFAPSSDCIGWPEEFIENASEPVSYTHLTLPTICSV